MARTTTRPAGFSPAAAAVQLSISRSGLYNLIKRGEIRAVKLGHRTIVPAHEIDRVLAFPTEGE